MAASSWMRFRFAPEIPSNEPTQTRDLALYGEDLSRRAQELLLQIARFAASTVSSFRIMARLPRKAPQRRRKVLAGCERDDIAHGSCSSFSAKPSLSHPIPPWCHLKRGCSICYAERQGAGNFLPAFFAWAPSR